MGIVSRVIPEPAAQHTQGTLPVARHICLWRGRREPTAPDRFSCHDPNQHGNQLRAEHPHPRPRRSGLRCAFGVIPNGPVPGTPLLWLLTDSTCDSRRCAGRPNSGFAGVAVSRGVRGQRDQLRSRQWTNDTKDQLVSFSADNHVHSWVACSPCVSLLPSSETTGCKCRIPFIGTCIVIAERLPRPTLSSWALTLAVRPISWAVKPTDNFFVHVPNYKIR